MRGIEDRWNPLLGFWHLGGMSSYLLPACHPTNQPRTQWLHTTPVTSQVTRAGRRKQVSGAVLVGDCCHVMARLPSSEGWTPTWLTRANTGPPLFATWVSPQVCVIVLMETGFVRELGGTRHYFCTILRAI